MSERSSGSNPAVNVSEELSALLQERERYETWIRQLESKVDATPRAVFERVMADYRTRLKAVLERVGGRTGELRTQIASLEARLAIVEKEHAEIRDERAEAELRHQVGEYTAEQWAEISAHTDEALKRAVGQRTDVAADVARLREIFAAATAGAEGTGESRAEDTPAEEAGSASAAEPRAAEPKAEPAHEEPTASAPGADPQETKAEAPVDAKSGAPPESMAEGTRAGAEAPAATAEKQDSPDRGRTEPPRAEADGRAIVEEAIVAIKPAPAQASLADAPPAPPHPSSGSPSSPSRASGGGARRTSGFDDLAFVSSLVTPEERRTPAVPQPAIPADVPPPRVEPRQSNEQRVSGVGRPSGPETPASFMKGVRGESVKTLKCQECGTLNYPTEWYCERCGGELAAL